MTTIFLLPLGLPLLATIVSGLVLAVVDDRGVTR